MAKSIATIQRVFKVAYKHGDDIRVKQFIVDATIVKRGDAPSNDELKYCKSVAVARREAINFAVAKNGFVDLYQKERVYP